MFWIRWSFSKLSLLFPGFFWLRKQTSSRCPASGMMTWLETSVIAVRWNHLCFLFEATKIWFVFSPAVLLRWFLNDWEINIRVRVKSEFSCLFQVQHPRSRAASHDESKRNVSVSRCQVTYVFATIIFKELSPDSGCAWGKVKEELFALKRLLLIN